MQGSDTPGELSVVKEVAAVAIAQWHRGTVAQRNSGSSTEGQWHSGSSTVAVAVAVGL